MSDQPATRDLEPRTEPVAYADFLAIKAVWEAERDELQKIFDAANDALACLETGDMNNAIPIVRYIKLKVMALMPKDTAPAPRKDV